MLAVAQEAVLGGVRLDSGDLPVLMREVREQLDSLGATETKIVVTSDLDEYAISTLQAVDLSSLNRPTELREFEDGQSRMATMQAEIETVMSAIADLATLVGDPAIAAELQPCAVLHGAYSALDLSQDTGTLTSRIVTPYEDCLRRARDVVARFQQPSAEKAFMAELSRHVRQLSEAHLSTVSP